MILRLGSLGFKVQKWQWSRFFFIFLYICFCGIDRGNKCVCVCVYHCKRHTTNMINIGAGHW